MTSMSDHHSRAPPEHEVAKQLGLSAATLRAWPLRGNGHASFDSGALCGYLAADVEHFIQPSVSLRMVA